MLNSLKDTVTLRFVLWEYRWKCKCNKIKEAVDNFLWCMSPYQETKLGIGLIKKLLTPFPIYYVVDSIDCDCVQGIHAWKAKNGRTYLKEIDKIYEYAEGQTSVYEITWEHYNKHTPTTRDYIAEATENGHPYSIRL